MALNSWTHRSSLASLIAGLVFACVLRSASDDSVRYLRFEEVENLWAVHGEATRRGYAFDSS